MTRFRIPGTLLAAMALLLASCATYDDGGGTTNPPPAGSFAISGPSEIDVVAGGESDFQVTISFDAAYADLVRIESGSWEAGLSVWHQQPGFPVALRDQPITLAGTTTLTLTLRASATAGTGNDFGTIIAQGIDERGSTRLRPSDQIKPGVNVR